MTYIHRVIESKLREYCDFFSVVGITGPRQSGKSTLLLHVLKEYTYVTFDDYRNSDLFYSDPEKFMRLYQDKVIFDEVQKVPELFNYIKLAVDRDRKKKGKFVLTGSSQFSFIKGISESLAGRIGLLTLLPYQYWEMPQSLRQESIYRGGYPELVEEKYKLFEDWFSSYLETYLLKDVSLLANVGGKRDFRRLISLLAANTSQILNLSTYAKELGVDVKTIKRWISVLEASYLIFLLPPYYKNYGKRIIKSPKVYFYDTGLVSFLTGIHNKEIFEKGPLFGPLFENYLVSEIAKIEMNKKTHAELFYYRTSHGDEIDLIIDRKNKKEVIEIKAGETFKPSMVAAMKYVCEKNDRGYLLYNGRNLPFSQSIEIKNYQDYLKSDFDNDVGR